MSDKLAIDAAIVALAERQHGTIATRQLLALGLDRDAIAYRVRVGRLFRLHRGVYAVGRRTLDRRGVWMAAVLACGAGAVLSHRSAGGLHGLLSGDGAGVDVSVVGYGGRKPRAGMHVHRVALEPWETASTDAIPATTPARTLVDLCAGAAPARIARLVTRAERLRAYDDRAVRRFLAAHPRAPGATRLAAALDIYEEPPNTGSELEDAMLALCERTGLPRPTWQASVEGERVDFLWARARLVVETDGRETHATRQAFEDDRARDAKLTAVGYRVVRFTYRQVLHQGPWVAGILGRLLR